VQAQIAGMARQFMLGNDEKEIIATLRKLHEQNIAFTVDLRRLGRSSAGFRTRANARPPVST
jgi:hypothetical protein